MVYKPSSGWGLILLKRTNLIKTVCPCTVLHRLCMHIKIYNQIIPYVCKFHAYIYNMHNSAYIYIYTFTHIYTSIQILCGFAALNFDREAGLGYPLTSPIPTTSLWCNFQVAPEGQFH